MASQKCDECWTRIKQGFPHLGRLFCTQTCLQDYGVPDKFKSRNQKRYR